ncbi:MAG: Phosphate transport system permease protein PstC [uncultured Rubrobacteraceae bacterium]|uniref:Phosphate transport system permease protein n=1 Tax=uncultured Rubrobacteraceae bacterium TaxID=349277 RepID=A0A6J4QJW7_9ACTN|nr:MAG: Phosphate transport system permease protein PstC [uncultured Rubrobacteraceae bacterium]
MAIRAEGTRSGTDAWKRNSRAREARERVIKVFLTACAYLSIFTTFGIVIVLFEETLRFFLEVSVVEFLTSTRWAPTQGDFGVLPLVYGTLVATIIAIAVALPIGLLTAIYLSEYAPSGLRQWLKPALEILAGVPTVVYGYFALTFITPLFRDSVFPGIESFNAISAGLIMGVMIIPTVASVSEDAIFAVPRSLREGAYALGATKRETATKVVLPAALSGIVAAVILGISRAIGETMIVTIAMGAQANWFGSPLEGMQAMTAYIVQVVGGETPRESVTYKSIFAVGSALFLMTLVLNLVSYWFVRRYRETY